jgi:carboxylesterase
MKPYSALILHGFTASLDCVHPISAGLEPLGIPVRMPVLRGHGADSPEALRGVTWHDWLADAETAFLELQRNSDKIILIGHSMGGLLAILLAEKYKGSVDSLVLAAAAVKMASPLAPGNFLSFAAPLLSVAVKKWGFPPVYADPQLAQLNTNYLWAPTDALLSVLDLARITRKSLKGVNSPALIIQSRKDATLAPENASIIYSEMATPSEQKQIAWFDRTGHEMFRDCERNEVIKVIVKYVQERIAEEVT